MLLGGIIGRGAVPPDIEGESFEVARDFNHKENEVS